jgi:hypothetical protein
MFMVQCDTLQLTDTSYDAQCSVVDVDSDDDASTTTVTASTVTTVTATGVMPAAADIDLSDTNSSSGSSGSSGRTTGTAAGSNTTDALYNSSSIPANAADRSTEPETGADMLLSNTAVTNCSNCTNSSGALQQRQQQQQQQQLAHDSHSGLLYDDRDSAGVIEVTAGMPIDISAAIRSVNTSSSAVSVTTTTESTSTASTVAQRSQPAAPTELMWPQLSAGNISKIATLIHCYC